MRHRLRGLQEDEALGGLDLVDSAAASLACDGVVVSRRVVTTQCQAEAVLSRGRSMTGARVAAQAGELRQDVVGEVDAPQIFLGGASLYGFTDADFAKADAAAAADPATRNG